MLNRNKRKAIIEWLNCLSQGSPVDSIPQLADGLHLCKIAKMINSSDEAEVDTVAARFIFIARCINDFYQTQIDVVVNFEYCERADEDELAKVCILLLSAVVQVSLISRDSLISSLTQLDSRVQEDIQECMSAVLLNSSNVTTSVLPPNFSSILSQQTRYKDVGISTPSRRSSYTPYRTPERKAKGKGKDKGSHVPLPSPAVSPLKQLLDSPQMLHQIHQVAMLKKSKEISSLRETLHAEENRCVQMESENLLLQQGIKEKDQEIVTLKEKVDDLRKYRDIADELSACSLDAEGNNEEKVKKLCENCKQLQQTIDTLESEYSSLNEEYKKNVTSLRSSESSHSIFVQEFEDSKRRNETLEVENQSLSSQVSELQNALKVSEELSTVNKAKYEDATKEINRMQDSPCKQCTKTSSTGESLESVPEKRIEELNLEVSEKERQLEELRSTIKQRDEDINVLKAEAEKQLSEFKSLEKKHGSLDRSHIIVTKNLCNMTEKARKGSEEKSLLKAELLSRQTEIGNVQEDCETVKQLVEEQINYESLIMELSVRLFSRETEYGNLEKQAEVTQEEKIALQGDVVKLTTSNAELTNQLQSVSFDNQRFSSQMENLKNQLKDVVMKYSCQQGIFGSQINFVDEMLVKKDQPVLDEITAMTSSLEQKLSELLECNAIKEKETIDLHSKHDCAEKEFRELRSKLELECDLAQKKLDEKVSHFQYQLEEAQSQIDVLSEKLTTYEDEKKCSIEKINALSESLDAKETEHQNLKLELEKVSHYRIQLEGAQSQIELLSEKLATCEDEKSCSIEKINTVSASLGVKETELQNVSLELEKVSHYRIQLEGVQSQLQFLNEKLATCEGEKKCDIEKIDVLSESLCMKETELQNLSLELAKTKECVQEQIAQLNIERDKYASCNSVKENLCSQLQEVLGELKLREKKASDLEMENQGLNSKLKKLTKEYQQEKERLLSQNDVIMNETETLLEKCTKLEAEMKKKETKIEELHSTNSSLQNDNAAYVLDEELLRGEINKLNEENRCLKDEFQAIHSNPSVLEEKKRILEELNGKDEQLKISAEENQFLKISFQEKENQHSNELTRLKKEVEDTRKLLGEEKSKFSESVDSFVKQVSELEDLRGREEQKVSLLQSQNNSISTHFIELETEITQLKSEVSRLQNENNKLNHVTWGAANENTDLRASMQSAASAFEKQQSEHAQTLLILNRERDELKNGLAQHLSKCEEEKNQLQAAIDERSKSATDSDNFQASYENLLAVHTEHAEICCAVSDTGEVVTLNENIRPAEKENLVLEGNGQCLAESKVLAEKDYPSCTEHNTKSLVELRKRNSKLQETISELNSANEKQRHLQNEIVNENVNLKTSLQEARSSIEKQKQVYEESVQALNKENIELKSNFDSQQTNYVEELCELQTALDEATKTVAEAKNYELQFERLNSSYVEHMRLCVGEAKIDELVILNAKIDCLETEKENLIEKIEELERNMRSLVEGKELAEKEYYMCVEQKDQNIERLENKISEIEASKSNNGQFKESEKLREDLIKLQVEHSKTKHKLLNEVEKSREIISENCNTEKKLLSLEAENKKYQEENEKYKKSEEKVKQMAEFYRTANNSSKWERAVKEHQQQLDSIKMKYTRAKERINGLEEERNNLEKELKCSSSELVTYQKIFSELESSNKNVRRELEQTRQSIVPLQEKVKQLESANIKIRQENRTLSAQLKRAENHLQALKVQAERNEKFSSLTKRYSHVSRFASSPAAFPKSSKSTLLRESKTKEVKELPPFFVHENTSKRVIKTYFVPNVQSSEQHANDSFNGSITSDGFNHSIMGPGSRFLCDDEEDYLNHSSLPNLRPSLAAFPPPSATKRINELKRRNTLCLPHLKSSYPVEMQMQPAKKCSDDSMRDGHKASVDLSSDEQPLLGAQRKGQRNSISPKRKRDNSSSSQNGMAKKQLKRSESLGMSAACVHTTAAGRIKNPFPKPPLSKFSFSTPTSVKKLFSGRKRNEKMPKDKKDSKADRVRTSLAFR